MYALGKVFGMTNETEDAFFLIEEFFKSKKNNGEDFSASGLGADNQVFERLLNFK